MAGRNDTAPLTFQLTLTVLSLALFSLMLVVGFGFYATVKVDRDSRERQRVFLANGLVEQAATLRREQESVTVWDEAVYYAKAGDQNWMTENLGVWLHTYYGHDRAYVLDDVDRPVHAMQDGQTVPAARYAGDEAAISPSVDALRAQLELVANGNPSDDPEKLVAGDIVDIDGKPAILSVMPLVPSSGRVLQEPGTEYIHASVQFIDDELISRIAGQYGLTGARLLGLSERSAANVPLVDSRGMIHGFVAWEPYRPGLGLVRAASPALLLGALLSCGVLAYLLRRLRRAYDQLQSSQARAQYLAFHDTLTGLPNRALFEDRLRRALAAAKRTRGKVALLYLDLDRFKHVNDTLGHPAGDELVRQTAARLGRNVREVDTVARLGGDEFALILVDVANVAVAEDICRRLLEEIGQPYTLNDDQVFVGASIGVALAPDSAADPDDLLRKADIALYEAKKNGRGRYQVFAGDMDDILARKRIIENDLRLALAAGTGIRLAYQPVFAPDGRTVLGAEALIRWDHPDHGSLSPAHFVGIAEERGMVGLLGDWVLRTAACFAVTTELPWIAVNVSPLQLRDETYGRHLLAIIAECGLAPSRLQIEITEGVLLESNSITRAVLSELRKAGVVVALDDFGTGHSSINYLRRHAIDKLKIDRTFVRELGMSADSVPIVRALIELASAVGVQVTAEGVETAEQNELLRQLGCKEFQGFLLSLPLEERDMRAMVSAAPERRAQRNAS